MIRRFSLVSKARITVAMGDDEVQMSARLQNLLNLDKVLTSEVADRIVMLHYCHLYAPCTNASSANSETSV